MIGKLVCNEVWGRDMWLDLCEWTKDVKIFVSPVNAHPKVDLSR